MLHVLFSLATITNEPNCSSKQVPSQQRDSATIQRLERAWSVAFLTGDTAFEQCLLLPDYTQINRDGSIGNLQSELALAARNRGKHLQTDGFPTVSVVIHGDAAVGYGVAASKRGRMRWADYYIWDGSAWHVYFAQQTSY
jgi:hypothetical protein